jgi:hypothetical protein
MIEIPGWDERFETAQSRASKAITWTPLRHSFVSVLNIQKPEVAMAMLKIITLAAGMPKRGVLHDGGRALTIEDLATYASCPRSVIVAAISALGGALSDEGGKEGGRELSSPPESASQTPPEPRRAGARPSAAPRHNAEWLKRIWHQEDGRPRIRSLSAARIGQMNAFVKECKCDEALMVATVQEFKKQKFHENGSYGIDTLCRPSKRSRYIDLGHASLNGEAKKGGYEWEPPEHLPGDDA